MDGSMDWGKDKGGKLPRHIERMEETEKPAQMKKGNDSNLPWGGRPAEQKKAYMQGEPANKGSMMSKTGATKGPSSMPQSDGKALQGRKVTQPSKSMPSAKPSKGKK